MKKTIIALLALSGVASAALTEIADMEDLIAGTSTVSETTGTKVTTVAGYDQTVYSLSSDDYNWVDNSVNKTQSRGAAWINGANESVVNAITSTTGGVVYVAAWINLASDATQYNTIFGWGEQNKGFKFGVKDDDLFIVTKNRTEKTGNFTIKRGEWTLVAVGFNTAADATDEAMLRIHATSTDGQMYSYKWSDGTNGDILPMHTPGTLTYSIGSSNGNATSGNEDFDGMIAGLKVFTSTSFETNPTIATAMGAAPTMTVPEPTTATLSLLALAGLAARRRRK